MNSNSRSQIQQPRTIKKPEVLGKKCTPKAKPASPSARLMADFYGIDRETLLKKDY